MVNFGLNSASILGIFLAVAGASLYFLRSVRPELSRDHDIFFAAVGLLCGFILLFQGWRLDPILQFGQFLLTGSAIFFAVESIRMRGVATEQARRNTPTVDDDRPVSRVYRAEIERINPYDNEDRYDRYGRVRTDSPRLRGTQEPRSSNRRSSSEPPRSRRSRRSPDSYSASRSSRTSESSYGSGRSNSRKRRPRPSNEPSANRGYDRYEQYDTYEQYDSWSEGEDHWEDSPRDSSPRSRRPQPSNGYNDSGDRDPRKGNSPRTSDVEDYQSSPSQETTNSDYVDYQPIEEMDNRQYQDPDWNPQGDRTPERDEDKPINFDY